MKLGCALKTAAVLSIGAALYYDNTRLDTDEIPVRLFGLPPRLDGLRIAVVADTHLPHCARRPRELAQTLKMLRPDLILMPGDIVDKVTPDNDFELAQLARLCAGIAPCYAVAGNHDICGDYRHGDYRHGDYRHGDYRHGDYRHGDYKRWRRLLTDGGVCVPDKKWVAASVPGGGISICGLTFGAPLYTPPPRGTISIALSHYPHYLPQYAAAGLDLAVCGHAHGGQARIAGQGLFAPGQGVFPSYTSGLYRMNRTQMMVSRGLCARFPLVRIANAPHLPVLVLHGAESPYGKDGCRS